MRALRAPASDDRSHRPNGADSRLIDVNDDSSDEDEEQTKNATAASARSDEGRQRKRRVVAAAARKRISNQGKETNERCDANKNRYAPDAATPCATNPMLVLPVRSNSRVRRRTPPFSSPSRIGFLASLSGASTKGSFDGRLAIAQLQNVRFHQDSGAWKRELMMEVSLSVRIFIGIQS